MGTERRQVVRWLAVGVIGVVGLASGAAWADRIRILGPGGEAPSALPGAQISPEFQRFVAGVRVGEARSHGPLRVFWLYGAPPAPLGVATLEEARARGDLLITERDQAAVPELIVENRGKAFVLLLAGEILLGGKQNRVLVEDILLPPHSGPRPIGVYCVEQGRWAGRSKDFDAHGSFAAPGLRSKVLRKEGQGQVWSEVERYARDAAAPSPTQSYQAIYEKPEVKAQLEAAERTLDHRAAPGAIGAAAFVGGRLAGLDLFFDANLFAREWPKLLRAQTLDVYGRPGGPAAGEASARQEVVDLLRTAGKVEGTLRANAGVGQLFEFRTAARRGSALLFEGRVVHAAIL